MGLSDLAAFPWGFNPAFASAPRYPAPRYPCITSQCLLLRRLSRGHSNAAVQHFVTSGDVDVQDYGWGERSLQFLWQIIG
jgi:hypothetical protein